MRKILIAFDGTHFSESALQFALKLNEKSPILLIGAFIPQVNIGNLWNFSAANSSGEITAWVKEGTAEEIQNNILCFESFCVGQAIEYRLHKDYANYPLSELKKETRFADLLILSSETFYADMGSEPNDYLKEMIHESECPVIIIPNVFEFPSCNVLTYDGSASSAFAIKQFAYLLPELINNATTLVYATENIIEPFPDEVNIEEMVARHFADLDLFRFGPFPKKYLSAWLIEKRGGILVSGSYSKPALNRLFHKSFADDIIKEHNLPLFIAHK